MKINISMVLTWQKRCYLALVRDLKKYLERLLSIIDSTLKQNDIAVSYYQQYVYSSALKNWLRKTSGHSRTHVLSVHLVRSPFVYCLHSPNHLSING